MVRCQSEDCPGYVRFLQDFRNHNVIRAAEHFHHDTSEVWWTNAIAGEAGEACNIAKKISRGDFSRDIAKSDKAKYDLAIELADVITYCDLLLAKLGWDTEMILRKKFDIVSERVGYRFRFNAD